MGQKKDASRLDNKMFLTEILPSLKYDEISEFNFFINNCRNFFCLASSNKIWKQHLHGKQ